MRYAKLERIVKTYYDALEEGKVLGRNAQLADIEFPPYLACNACGNLDTEWVDLTNTRARILQVLPPLNVFPEMEFQEANNGFVAICVKIDNADPYVTSMVHVGKDAYERIHENMEHIIVKPYIIQGADTKICSWVDENFKEPIKKKKAPEVETVPKEEEVLKTAIPAADKKDVIVQAVIAAAAEGYDVDPSEITLATDIREDLSPQSMKMIVMLSGIEEALDITIDITEAGELNTIADFVNIVRDKLGMEGAVCEEGMDAFERQMQPAQQIRQNTCSNFGRWSDEMQESLLKQPQPLMMDPSGISLTTDIREDLSPQSMKMIVMLSGIEEALDITIDITEAGELNTLAEFVAKVKKIKEDKISSTQ